MEDKEQVLNHVKTAGDNERAVVQSPSSFPGHPVAGPPAPPNCSRDYVQTGSSGCKSCRECLSAMAHRLAQPVTALRGGIELALMQKRTAADYRSVLEETLQLADNVAQLIVSLRDLGESGGPAGPARSVLLPATTSEILTEMQGMAESRDLRLQVVAHDAVKVCANPERLREALQSLLTWVIRNSAGGDVISLEISASDAEARLSLSLPRLDLQYLQIKALEDITTPGLIFSHAAKNGALGWAIHQRLVEGLGGKLEIITDGLEAGCIRVRLPLAPEES
jgi:two-component system sensor histidine kinase BaeS